MPVLSRLRFSHSTASDGGQTSKKAPSIISSVFNVIVDDQLPHSIQTINLGGAAASQLSARHRAIRLFLWLVREAFGICGGCRAKIRSRLFEF